jgi:hypothetical protein
VISTSGFVTARSLSCGSRAPHRGGHEAAAVIRMPPSMAAHPALALDTRIGAHNGTSRSAPFDRWFRYPAGLSQAALPLLFAPDRNPERGGVLDPFCGAGTIGSATLGRGLPFLGIEAHPEIAELAALKVSKFSRSASDLLRYGRAVLLHNDDVNLETEENLVRRCFSDATLRRLVQLREGIAVAPTWTRPYLKWALLGTLRDVANVKVGWPYLQPKRARTATYGDSAERMLTRLEWIAHDLHQRDTASTGRVLHGDAAEPKTWADRGDEHLTVCLTSPPYLNNFDYADATRLEMFFWGRNHTWAQMCSDVRARMLIATTQQTSVASTEEALGHLETWPAIYRVTAKLTDALAQERRRRPRGKEYDRVLPCYVYGIARTLERVSENLQPKSWCGWVVGDSAPYGVYIDTPKLIRTVASTLGYSLGKSTLLRRRGLRWRTNGTRHQVDLTERLVWFRTP